MTSSATILKLLLLLSVAFTLATFRDGHEWGDDFAQYIEQSVSVVNGTTHDFLRNQEFMTRNSTVVIGPGVFPWGYPLILAPVIAVFGLNIFAMKIWTYLFYLLTLVILLVMFGRRLPQPQILLLLIVLTLAPGIFVFRNNILSDLPFFCLSMGAVAMMQAVVVDKQRVIGSAVDQLVIGAAMAAAVLVRTQGIMLFAALFLTQVITYAIYRSTATSDRTSLIVNLIPYASAIALIAGVQQILPASSYLSVISPADLSRVIFDNMGYYATLPAEFFSPPVFDTILPGIGTAAKIAFAFTIPVVLVGFFARMRTDYLYAIVILCNLGLVIPYPFTQGVRFIFPCIPFYLYFFVVGTNDLSSRFSFSKTLKNRSTEILLIGVAFICFIADGGIVLRSISGQDMINGPYAPEGKALVERVIRDTKPDDVIIFHKPRALRLMTGRSTIAVHDKEKIVAGIGDWVIVDQTWTDAVGQPKGFGDKRADPEGYLLTYENARYRMYRVLRP